MSPDAARMKRWILWGAPVMLLAALRLGAGGAAAAWTAHMILGLLLPARPYPYIRKNRVRPHRLFWACSVELFVFSALFAAARHALAARSWTSGGFFVLAGAVFFSLPVCAYAFGRFPPRKIAWSAGSVLLLCAAGVMWV